MPEFTKRNFIIVLVYSALILSTLLVFWQVRNFDFVNYDDQLYVYENTHVLKGLTGDSIIWAFTACQKGYWQPLTWLSLIINCQLFGSHPGGFHLVNVFLHLANTLLLFWVLKKMTSSLWSSAFVAALFAIHPMHVESVTWISERKDVLSTLFWLLTMWAYVRYARSVAVPATAKRVNYILALIFFALGLMSKPMLVTLPFILLLLDYWPLNRIHNPQSKIRNLLLEKIPFFILAAISSVVTFLTQKVGTITYDTETIALSDRAGNAFLSYARYIGKLFVPRNLAVSYPFDAGGFVFWQVAMSIVLLIVISIFVIRFRRNHKYLAVGWFWFIGMLVPVIGLVKFTWSSYSDRFTYIPYIGLFIMLAWGLPDFLSKWPHRKIVLSIAAPITLIALGTGAFRQVSVWKDSITLYSHAIEVTHNNALVHNYLGMSYLNLKRYQDAIESLKQAIAIDRNCTDAYYNLGVAFDKVGRWEESIDAFKQVIQARPHYAEAHYNLGNAYLSLGRSQDALEIYKRAVILDPALAEAQYNLGNAYSKLGRYQDAIEAYKQAIKIKPGYIEAYNNLGNACVSMGRFQEAAEAFKQVIKIKPDFADAYNNLGNACLGMGRWQDAVENYKQAIRIQPNWAQPYCNLGAAYGTIGSFQEALEAYKQAVGVDPALAEAHNGFGAACLDLGRYQESLEPLKRAISIEPNYADAHYNLGNAYSKLGRYQDAIEPFKQAIRIKPDWLEAHYNLGITYLIIGDKDSALEEYKILKTLGAKHADQLYNLIQK
jgi:tetratricopeptide (TPR) repeat protein